MQKFLVENITKQIEKVKNKDIYAFDLYLEFVDDDAYQPLIIFGFNTLKKVKEEIKNSDVDEYEAKWNYAYWLQNSLFTLGEEPTKQIVEDWLVKNKFGHQSFGEFSANIYVDDDLKEKIENKLFNLASQIDKRIYELSNKIEKKLCLELAKAIKTVQKSSIIQKKFGKSLPIIIHQLETTDFLVKLNKKSNPKNAMQGFNS